MTASERRNWFLDLTPFQVAPTAGESVIKAGGASYIYTITQNPAAPRDLKKAPYIGTGGDKALLDISGPGSRLDDLPADQYKLCAMYKAGECWEGWRPGEIYANLPSLSGAGCSTGEVFAGKSDLYAFHVAAYGQAVVQFGPQNGRGGRERARAGARTGRSMAAVGDDNERAGAAGRRMDGVSHHDLRRQHERREHEVDCTADCSIEIPAIAD